MPSSRGPGWSGRRRSETHRLCPAMDDGALSTTGGGVHVRAMDYDGHEGLSMFGVHTRCSLRQYDTRVDVRD